MIPHSRPSLGPQEETAVRRVLASGQLSQGPEVEAVEAELARQLGSAHCVAVSSGTAALHLALLGLGARPGLKVLLPSYACVSLLQAVTCCGSTPVLVDSASDRPDLDLDAALGCLTSDTLAAVVPPLFGRDLDTTSLQARLPVVRDLTHCAGGPVAVGTIAVASFGATKMLTAGEGGAVFTQDRHLADRVRDLRSYDERDDFRPRFNYKMTDLGAALLRVQLTRLPAFVQRRRELAAFYREALQGISGVLPAALDPQDVCYRFTLRLEGQDPELRLRQFREQGIGIRRPIYRPMHHYLPGWDCPRAEEFWRTTLSLPCYPALSEEEARQVVESVGSPQS